MISVLWEAMIAEMRDMHADLHFRATFAKDGEQVRETRGIVDEWANPAPTEQDIELKVKRSASRIQAAYEGGFVEVG